MQSNDSELPQSNFSTDRPTFVQSEKTLCLQFATGPAVEVWRELPNSNTWLRLDYVHSWSSLGSFVQLSMICEFVNGTWAMAVLKPNSPHPWLFEAPGQFKFPLHSLNGIVPSDSRVCSMILVVWTGHLQAWKRHGLHHSMPQPNKVVHTNQHKSTWRSRSGHQSKNFYPNCLARKTFTNLHWRLVWPSLSELIRPFFLELLEDRSLEGLGLQSIKKSNPCFSNCIDHPFGAKLKRNWG